MTTNTNTIYIDSGHETIVSCVLFIVDELLKVETKFTYSDGV